MRNLLLTILSLLLLAACTNSALRTQHSQLAKADSLMHTHPDSALALLQSISADSLTDAANHDYHAQLLSQALDKNYIDKTDDSLINIAVTYYADTPVTPQQMLAHYYQARIKQNAKAYPEALYAALHAEAAALQLNDHYHLGLIYRLMMECYDYYHRSEESFRYAQLSYDHFALTEHERYAKFALLDLADSYMACRKMEQTIEILKPLLKTTDEKNDSTLLFKILASYSNALMCMDKYATAKEQLLRLQTIRKRPLTTRYYAHLAVCYLYENQLDSALYYGAKAEKMIKNDADRYLYEDFKYLYHRKEKNFETALAAYRKASAHHDAAMATADNHEIDTIVQQFHEEQLKIVQKRTLKHYTFVALLLLLIMIGISLGYLCYSRRQMRRRIDAYHQLQKSLELLSQRQANQDAVLLKLYKEKYHAFVSLTERCNKSIGSKDEQKFLKELKKELNSLKTPEFRLQIENDINSYRNHIIRDLRQQVPTISEAELAYIIYSQAGFPLPVIEQFLEVNQRKLYYYRDCIKKKIAKANAPDMDRFLRELL